MPDFSDAPTFELFGTAHMATVLTILGVALVLPALARRSDTVRPLAWAMAAFMVVHEVIKTWAWVAVYGSPWREHLPLHLCGISIFLCAVLLVRRHRPIYEIVYFWGLGGTLQAILTPDLPAGFPHPIYWMYYLSHGMIIVAVVFATFAFKLRPTWGSLPRVMIVTNLYALFIGGVNWALGTNYLYLCAKPPSASLLDHLGPWPWYILSLEGMLLLSFVVYYAPFAVADALAGRRTLAADVTSTDMATAEVGVEVEPS